MRDKWNKLLIGEEVNLLGGFPFSSLKFNEEGTGLPLIRIRDLLESSQVTYFDGQYTSPYLIQPGDILVGMDGDFHVVRWKSSPSLLNQRILKVYDKKNGKIDIDYFFYFLQPFLIDVHNKTSATTVKHLSTYDISRTVREFPPLPQQRKIARILSTCDAVIEKTEAAIAKYRALKQGLMHDLFTRGIDGSTGRLRPKYEDAPELYRESELGWVPREWEVKRLGDLGSFKKGSNIPKYSLAPSGVGCILYGELYTRYLNVIKSVYSRVPEAQVSDMKPLNNGDILFAGSGETHEEIGISAVCLAEETVYAGGDIVVLSLSEECFAPYFGYFLNDARIQSQKSKLGQGSSVIHIYPTHLASIVLGLPNKEEQEEIFIRINSIETQLNIEYEQLSKYRQMKAGLMQDLLTGKVEVSVEEKENELL